MSARRDGSDALRRQRCWLCRQERETVGGRRVTEARHWVCRDCWDRKVYEILRWFTDTCPDEERTTLLERWFHHLRRPEARA